MMTSPTSAASVFARARTSLITVAPKTWAGSDPKGAVEGTYRSAGCGHDGDAGHWGPSSGLMIMTVRQ